jgi:hypothetical protein
MSPSEETLSGTTPSGSALPRSAGSHDNHTPNDRTQHAHRRGAPSHQRTGRLGPHRAARHRPAPRTPARARGHDSRCVVGVLEGIEHEELYDEQLNPIGTRDGHPGDVSGFAPPGDIHRIRNTGTRNAISLHIYGTDITRVGTSARRFYD